MGSKTRRTLIVSGFVIGLIIYGLATGCSTFGQLFKLGDLIESTHDPATEIVVENEAYKRANALFNESRYLEAEPLFQQALEEVKEEYGSASLEAALVEQHSGRMYLNMGKWEDGYDLLNSAYVTFRDNLGSNDGKTIEAKCQIADYDLMTGNTDEAIKVLEEALADTDYYVYEIQISDSLAAAYESVGRYLDALALFDTVEKEWLLNQSYEDNWIVATLYNDHALCLYELGRTDEALEKFDMALGCFKSNDCNATIALVHSNKASTYYYMGKTSESLAEAKLAAKTYEQLYGKDGISYAMSLNSLGSLYNMIGEYGLAYESLDEALELALRTVGHESLEVSMIMSNLAAYYEAIGNYGSAIDSYNEQLDIQRNILGLESPQTIQLYENLSALYGRMGEYDKAQDSAQRALRIAEGYYNEGNPAVGSAYAELASIENKAGDCESAKEHIDKALAVLENASATNTFDYAYACQAAGQIARSIENYSEAESYFKKSLAVYSSISGEDAVSSATLYRDLGDLYMYMGKMDEAQKQCETALEILKKKRPAGYDDLAVLTFNLGFINYTNKDYPASLDYYSDSLKYRELQIASIPKTDTVDMTSSYTSYVATINNIAAVYEDDGDMQKAIENVKRAYSVAIEQGIDYLAIEKARERANRLFLASGYNGAIEDWLLE